MKYMRKILFLSIIAAAIFLPILTVYADTPAGATPSDSEQFQDTTYTCTCADTCEEYVYSIPIPVPIQSGGNNPPAQSVEPAPVTGLCQADCTQGSFGSTCPPVVPGQCDKKSCRDLPNPLALSDKQISVPTILGNIIKGALGIVGSLALLMIVWGGFQWLVSMGNPEKVKSGLNTMLWAAIGLVLVFASYMLVSNLLLNIKPEVQSATAPATGGE